MKFISISLLFFTLTLLGQNITCELPKCKNGVLYKHTYYTFKYSEKHEQPFWVAYKLSPQFLEKNSERSNRFKEDKIVITGSASLNDYKKSGYDRGHLAPAGSMVYDKIAMNESFYMSNMSPQVPGFNRGIWKKLESKVRNWALASDSLYVVTGPILKDITKTIGANKISVPTAYYKVLLRFVKGKVKTCAYILPNKKSNAPLVNYICPIDLVEKITGIDFNESLPDKVEYNLEHDYDVF